MLRLKGILLTIGLCACGPSKADGGDGGSSGASSTGPGSEGSPTTASTTVAADTTAGPLTTSDATSGSGGGSSSEGNFVMTPDVAVLCATSSCDTWSQDCAEGSKCAPAKCAAETWERTSCVPLDPDPAAIGDPCTAPDGPYGGVDDCDLGALCWNVDPETLQGTCIAMCGGNEANPTCASASDACFIAYDGLLTVCLPQCDPLAPDCAADEACVFDDPPGDDAFVCLPQSLQPAAAYGDDCSEAPACGTGLLCRPAAQVPGCATAECCTTLGRLGDPPDCPDGSQTCLPLYADGAAPVGLEDVCFCGTG